MHALKAAYNLARPRAHCAHTARRLLVKLEHIDAFRRSLQRCTPHFGGPSASQSNNITVFQRPFLDADRKHHVVRLDQRTIARFTMLIHRPLVFCRVIRDSQMHTGDHSWLNLVLEDDNVLVRNSPERRSIFVQEDWREIMFVLVRTSILEPSTSDRYRRRLQSLLLISGPLRVVV